MLKIGLTGGIGSGKTTVCSVFRELGVSVYDADSEARRLMESDAEIVRLITSLLGPNAYRKGRLNRIFTAEAVFSDKQRLAALNAIVHPAVQQDFDKWALGKSSEPYVIREAAILFESGGAAAMDYTIFVKAGINTRISRVVERDQVAADQVQARIDSQMNDKEKEDLSDFIINNEINSMILPQIVDLHNKFLKLNR
ncbi:MAG: dephospho-CoA kinase [Bacteroidales bacterium]